ncbi:MAG: haloalkane dehalogenase [Moritella sp.]
MRLNINESEQGNLTGISMKEFSIININARMRYHDFPGDDMPILFIHGLGCASSLDYPQVAAMAHLSQHRRILVDLLGSGFSDKPEHFNYSMNDHVDYLEAFIDYLGLEGFIIYGHSMGGAIAISLAARCEAKLKGIILSEANLDSGGGFFSKKIASYEEQEYLLTGHTQIIQENQDDQGNASENWAASLSVSSPKAVYKGSQSLIEGQSPSWRNLFYSLNIPRAFIFGEESLPDPDLQALTNENVHIEIVKNAGHSMAWENPVGLATAIKRSISLIR